MKKRVLVKKRRTMKRKTALGALRGGNITTVNAAAAAARLRKLPLDRKAALKSKIQDILMGRSRFVIRRTPPPGRKEGSAGGGGGVVDGGGGGAVGVVTALRRGKEKVELSRPDGAVKAKEESNANRCFLFMFCFMYFREIQRRGKLFCWLTLTTILSRL